MNTPRPDTTGASPPRPDGLAKVSGSARFADDVEVPGLWHGVTVRSPHARARITALKWHPDRAPIGAVCVTADDLPGPNGIQLVDDSWPILAAGEVNHVGEPVALIAARTKDDARRACDAVEVEYEPLEPVLSLEDASHIDALYEINLDHGDVDAALANASVVVSGEYQTGHQEHLYLECQGATAAWSDGSTLSIVGTMQCPYYVHKAVTHALGLDEHQVRIRATAVGGGFGGKEDYPSMIGLHAALLARAADAPVRIVYDRQEDIAATTKRHPSRVRHRTAVDEGRRLLAMDIEIVLDGGAYLTLSSVVLSRAVLHAAGPYRCPNVRIRGVVGRTNTATNGAFRGFGVPQVAFAVERHMDRIARQVGLDPYEIRARNVLVPGDSLPTGQRLESGVFARECLDAAVARTRFLERWHAGEAARDSAADGSPRKGIGLSLFFHGAGFTGNGERRMQSPVTARLLADGRIEVCTAATDMGQGSAIALPMMAAEAAGVSLDDVVFSSPDTDLVPDSGPTVASRTTMVVGGTIALAVADVRSRVLSWWRDSHGANRPFRDIARHYVEEVGGLEVTRHHEPPAWQTFDEATYQGAAYPAYSWGADVVEVDVDPDTFETRAISATSVCEVGRVIHPTLCVGQIEGGTLQAIGYGLMEEMKLDRGRYLNDRLATYIIPTSLDAPRIDVQLLDYAAEGGSATPKGVGELPMDGAAPAVAAAVENAIGLQPTAIPVTPERLLELAAHGR